MVQGWMAIIAGLPYAPDADANVRNLWRTVANAPALDPGKSWEW